MHLMKSLPTRCVSILIVLCLIGISFSSSGCYHQQVVTGKTPSSTVIENQWATSLVYGLVPPPIVETAQECPDGVARVETKISFLNGLVAALTASIYTPISVKVTCASGGMSTNNSDHDLTVPTGASDKDVTTMIQGAVNTSLATGEPVAVRFK